MIKAFHDQGCCPNSYVYLTESRGTSDTGAMQHRITLFARYIKRSFPNIPGKCFQKHRGNVFTYRGNNFKYEHKIKHTAHLLLQNRQLQFKYTSENLFNSSEIVFNSSEIAVKYIHTKCKFSTPNYVFTSANMGEKALA